MSTESVFEEHGGTSGGLDTPAARQVPSYSAVRRRQHILRLTIAVPALVIGLGSYWFAQEQLKREVESRMRWLAQNKAETVSDWVRELKLDLAALSRLDPLQQWITDWADDPGCLTDSITAYLEVIQGAVGRHYDGFAVFGARGQLWGGSSWLTIPDSSAFATAAAGSTSVAFRLRHRTESQSDIRVYAPVFGRNGDIVAILAGAASDQPLINSLSDLYSPPGQRICLIDSTGWMITCRAGEREVNREYAQPGIAAAARSGTRVVKRYRTDDGEEILGALNWIEPLGWGVLAERNAGEAFGPLDRWRYLITAAVLTVIGFGFALSTILGSRMMHQLEIRELELRSTHEQLITADRLASVGMMAASIAHEVNNPLTTIKVLIHSVHDRIVTGEDVHEDLHVMQGEIDKIKALVLRFLQFARPREPEFASVDVNGILRRVLALVRPQAQSRNLTLLEDYDQQLPPVWADGPQLGQVFLNILFNAIEAAPENGEIRAATSLTDDGKIMAEIWNSGEGLSPDLVERVFEPFFSTKATGTGLGLPIARIIVDKHHGSIAAEGHGERGTSFFITLPRESPGGSDAPRIGG